MRVTVIATGFADAEPEPAPAAPAANQAAQAPQPLNETQGETAESAAAEADRSFEEILKIFNRDKF